MLDDLPRIKKDLLEINRNDKENTTQISTPSANQVKSSPDLILFYNFQRASTMRESKEGCDQSCRIDCGYEGLGETAS